jgi:hypothetical protein
MTTPKNESLTFDKFAIREKLALTLAKDGSGSYVSYSTILADKAWKESRRAFAKQLMNEMMKSKLPDVPIRLQPAADLRASFNEGIASCIDLIRKTGGLE